MEFYDISDFNEKTAYLTFSHDHENSVFEILNTSFQHSILNKDFSMPKIWAHGSLSNLLFPDVAIFFLTNNIIRSLSFKKKYKFLKDKGKPMLFVLINNIEINDLIDITGFNVIRFVEPINSDANKEALKHFQIFLFSVLRIKSFFFHESIDDYSSRMQLISNKKTFNYNATDSEMKSTDETFLLSYETFENFFLIGITLKIINYNNDNVLGEISLGNCEDLFCYIDHLKMVFIIPVFTNQKRQICGELYDINGKFVRKVELSPIVHSISRFSSVAYNQENNETYFVYSVYDENADRKNGNATIFTYDKYLRLKVNTSRIYAYKITIYKQYIYSIYQSSMYKSPKIFIYDFSFNLVASFIKEVDWWLLSNLRQTPYIFIGNDLIFDTKTFSFIGFFKTQTESRLITAFKDKLIFKDFKGNYLIYKIDLKTAQNNLIDSKYICKINPLKPHLYQNPYLLPCGNSACLDCIYKHFNIYLNEFICNFESCQQSHRLTQDLNLNDIMISSCQNILKNMIEGGNFILSKKGIYIYIFVYCSF